jgi:hypothetical protein
MRHVIAAARAAEASEFVRIPGHQRLFLGCAKEPLVRSHGFYRHLGWRPTGQVDANDDEILELQLPLPAS